jgi:L-iditol 2-dehydrogenase
VIALRLHAAGDLRLHDEPPPEPAAGELLLRVSAVGLCGSDLHWFEEGSIGDAVLSRPLVLGHEFAATVQDGPRAGERVAVDPARPCGRCEECRAGREHLCPNVRFCGHGTVDGALRSLLAWPAELAHPLPEALSDEEGALLEPLGVALHALDIAQVEPGEAVGVFGCGPIGLLIVQALRAAGVEWIAVHEPLPHRLAAAGETAEATALDVAFEAAGTDEAVEEAIEALRPGGRLILVGIPASDRTTFTASVARRKELEIRLVRRMRASDLPRAIRLATEGGVELAPLVTHRYPLTDGPAAFEALASREGLKVVVEP